MKCVSDDPGVKGNKQVSTKLPWMVLFLLRLSLNNPHINDKQLSEMAAIAIVGCAIVG